MGIFHIAMVSGTTLFMGGLYLTYNIHLIKSFESRYTEILSNKKLFHETHDQMATTIDETVDKFEQQF
jgi:hypothetical protein